MYQQQHLGNYRTYIFKDVLHKYLEYLGFRVERAINFTDIEDKAIKRLKNEDDYNRAILESYSGNELAHYWLHGEHLIVGGEKMSKSKGNTMYPKDAYAHGCSPQQVRFMLMCAHYRRQLNITEEHIDECCRHFSTIRQTLETIRSGSKREHSPEEPARAHKTYRPGSEHSVENLIREVQLLFTTRMNDDLDTPGAIESLEALADEFYTAQKKGLVTAGQRDRFIQELHSVNQVLGVLFPR